jgi:hypothetical protein
MHKLDSEGCWKTDTWKIRRQDNNAKMDPRKVSSEYGRWVELILLSLSVTKICGAELRTPLPEN